MSKFNRINTASKLERNGNVVEIVKFQKEGTSRIFFAPEFNGQRLTKTMFGRKYDAENLARTFLKK